MDLEGPSTMGRRVSGRFAICPRVVNSAGPRDNEGAQKSDRSDAAPFRRRPSRPFVDQKELGIHFEGQRDGFRFTRIQAARQLVHQGSVGD